MNTCKQPEAMEQRLQTLARHEPTAAAQIRAALDGAPVWPTVEPDPVWQQDLAHWLQTQPQIPDIIVVPGVGTPGEMRCLASILPPQTRLLLLEHDTAQLAGLFQNWAMEELAGRERLAIAAGADLEQCTDKIIAMIGVRTPSIVICDRLQSNPRHRNFYQQVLQQVRKQIKISVFNVNTLLHHGPMWQFNSLKNLPILLDSPDINTLFHQFAGRPAVVVGAGPSLNQALPFLKRNAGKCVILTAATALRPLRTAGIRPDLVVAVDGSHRTAPQFTPRCDDLFLACSSMAYPPALARFRGCFAGKMDANPIDHWLIHNGLKRGDWTAGGTVTTSALDLAIKMGCNPVVSMGFDLSFADDGTTHANKTMYHGSRLDPARLIKVPGNYQPQVLTTDQFKVYLDLLEVYLRQHPDTRFINATTGGARIKGMELQQPDILDAMTGDGMPAYDRVADIHTSYNRPDFAVFRDKLAVIADQFTEVINGTRQAARICNRLIMMLKSPCTGDETTARDHLKQLEQIDRHFAEIREASLLLDMSLWPVNFNAELHHGGHGQETADVAIETNRRSREVYEQITGAAMWTRELILEDVEKLDGMAAGQSDPQTAIPSGRDK